MFDNRWDNWTGDFAESFAASHFDPPTRDRISEILHHFGESTRKVDPDFPDHVASATFATVFRNHLARLNLPVAVRDDLPEVVARFFEFLQEGGRLRLRVRLGRRGPHAPGAPRSLLVPHLR